MSRLRWETRHASLTLAWLKSFLFEEKVGHGHINVFSTMQIILEYIGM